MVVRLTYCGNVHAATDLPAFLAALRQHAAPVAAAAKAAGREFGLGSFWPQPLVDQLHDQPEALDALRDTMTALEVPLWTLNAFPYGDFHEPVVKTAVYQPDWGTEERLLHTRRCAEVAARLLPAGASLPISTLPLGYRPRGAAAPDWRLMARNLARCASALADLEQRSGVTCVLALEPEPDCLLETCADAAEFLERWLFAEGSWPTVTQAVLRRHVGLCVDLCHLAVVGEDALAALQDLAERGIAVPKIQVSACLEVREAAGLDRLLQFAEPRYLHQTVAANGPRALDLDEVARRRAEFAAAGRLRCHYHVPLYWDEPGAFGSTRAEVQRVLAGLAAGSIALPLLEVETYTWGVLGDLGGTDPLALRIARELDFAAQCLAGHPAGP